MSTMIDGYSEGHLLRTAQTLVEKKAAATKIFDPEADERIPTFDMSGKVRIEPIICVFFCLVCSGRTGTLMV